MEGITPHTYKKQKKIDSADELADTTAVAIADKVLPAALAEHKLWITQRNEMTAVVVLFALLVHSPFSQPSTGSTIQAEKMARNKRAASNCRGYSYGRKPPCYRSPDKWLNQLIRNRKDAISFCARNYKESFIREILKEIYPENQKKLLNEEIEGFYVGPCPCSCPSLCEGSAFTPHACHDYLPFHMTYLFPKATTETNTTPSIAVRSTSISKKYSLYVDTMEATMQQSTADSMARESPTQRYPQTTNSDKIKGSSGSNHPSSATAFASSQQGGELTSSPVVEFSSEIVNGYTEFTSPEVENTSAAPSISSDQETSTTSKESDRSFTTAAFKETVPSTDSMYTSVKGKEWESTIFHLTEETTPTERPVLGRSTEPSLVSTRWMEILNRPIPQLLAVCSRVQ
ncbi:hypothetical protein Y032_0079g1256 [Ancylostoma ceylanicum]|uniref:Uncharacterized protein n=1 Tax=Ancylostoma ceylanicum TaxID=53326 RepID=A0A016TU39_9BILA|nr:hypothetical protein Y032_0079g1256 [Ancylostoma ceylanicum]